MNKRTETAIEVLKNGGCFRYALERNYHGHEKFKMRLLNAQGRVVKGVGFATKEELNGSLQYRHVGVTSTWAQEWVWGEGAAA